MAPCKYKADELLRLRGSGSSQLLEDRVKMHPDLADVIKARGSNTRTGNTTLTRRQKKTKEEVVSSTNSEEHIIFQGKKQPSHLPIGILDGEMEWKYRGRTDSEHNSSEPLSAPTGIDAQQNEGFRRFFKAVVSPTHVRVTAGGRIVPNTRAPTSPTVKWNKGQSPSEDDTPGNQDKPEPQKGSTCFNNQASGSVLTPMMMHPMMSSVYPGYPPMFSPVGAAMPFYPIHNGMPLPYGISHTQATMTRMHQNLDDQVQKPDETAGKAANTENDQGSKDPRPAPIKISPPEQFDQTRPYFYNGNVFYPSMGTLPYHGPGTPLTPSPFMPKGFVNPALAPSGSFAQPSSTTSMPSPHGFPTPNFVPQTSAMSAGAPTSQKFPQSAPKIVHALNPTAPKPPITSIKPSEITKSQLASLRSQLRYYEDQMQYNKHQIDENATQEQIRTIRSLIDQFEHNFSMQLKFETSYYSEGSKQGGSDVAASDAASCQTPSRAPSIKENTHDVGSAKQSIPALSHTQSLDHIRLHSLKDIRQRAGINSSKGNDTNTALGALEAHLKHTKQARNLEPTKKSSLSTDAAMAPAFEPREIYSVPSQSDVGSFNDATPHSSDSPWELSSLLPHSQPGLWAKVSPSAQGLAGGRLFYGTGIASQNPFGSLASPYLVGKLPHGMNPQTARATDYLYSRELTDEEKRARHVYWGQVPSKDLGLPKFDGKDFYPASPTKASDKIDAPAMSKPRQIPMGCPEMDLNFEQPKKPEDPFRTSRGTGSIRSGKSVGRASHAVPIINPDTLSPENVNTTPKATKSSSSQGNDDLNKEHGSVRDNVQSSPSRADVNLACDTNIASLNRRALQRSSKGSSNDLWQSMLKKGSTSGTATPSAMSSTTATGYLPQHRSSAAASLSPTFANAKGSQNRASSGNKSTELAAARQKSKGGKMGENRPPRELASKEADIIADLHERMLRDAERRGIIGPGWQ